MGREPKSVVSLKSASRAPAAVCEPRSTKPKRRSLDALVPLVKALGDANRLAIIELLLGADAELCACDVEAATGLAQPTVSHHMRVLRDAGLVDSEKRGLWVYYAPTRTARRTIDALLQATANSK